MSSVRADRRPMIRSILRRLATMSVVRIGPQSMVLVSRGRFESVDRLGRSGPVAQRAGYGRGMSGLDVSR